MSNLLQNTEEPNLLSTEVSPVPKPPEAAAVLWFAVSIPALCVLFSLLSFWYEKRFPMMLSTNDVWFGEDISRHLMWMTEYQSARSYLHPLSFAIFWIYGRVGILTGIFPSRHALVVGAMPVVIFTAFALAISAWLLSASGKMRWFFCGLMLLGLLSIGQFLLFAPVVESHALGGASLLLCGVLAVTALNAPKTVRSSIYERLSIWCAMLAAGFSLTNLFLALPLLLLLGLRRNAKAIVVSFGALGLILLAMLVHYKGEAIVPNSKGASGLLYELNFMTMPSLKSAGSSAKQLIVDQFGVPNSKVVNMLDYNPKGEKVFGPMPMKPSPLSVLGLIIWVGGIAIWFRTIADSAMKRFVVACLTSLTTIIIFHTVYDTPECFIFSIHAAPFVLLPGLIALKDASRKRNVAVGVCLVTTIALSLCQTLNSLPRLIAPDKAVAAVADVQPNFK